ncbi:hypothetical protein OX283_004525 [Flavobacterium sp. SUN052]|uniref:hypothetical protein n=1 Tax=Flavobacterium sp. SUN052 TaxID=3002441 RepID=UPI00237DAD12|nr:hypothetical protein [Flavobacterium sp. SUN052]MEC4003910.1 hypothetical protein [Flavobacterium sp. SUN052]
MKILKICTAFIVLSTLVLFSCESRTYEDISDTFVANPTYTANVKPIIENNCLSCHGANTNAQYPPMESYADVRDAAENGEMICRIDDQSCGGAIMPQTGKMPQVTIDIIKRWKQQGYAN